MKYLNLVLPFLGIIFRNFKIKAFINDFVEPAITIVQLVKNAVENQKLQLLVEYTKTDLDDKIKKRISDILTKAIKSLVDVNEWSKEKPLTEGEIIDLFLEWLRNQKKPIQSAVYQKLASTITFNQSGKEAKEFEIDALVNLRYAMRKEEEIKSQI